MLKIYNKHIFEEFESEALTKRVLGKVFLKCLTVTSIKVKSIKIGLQKINRYSNTKQHEMAGKAQIVILLISQIMQNNINKP